MVDQSHWQARALARSLMGQYLTQSLGLPNARRFEAAVLAELGMRGLHIPFVFREEFAIEALSLLHGSAPGVLDFQEAYYLVLRLSRLKKIEVHYRDYVAGDNSWSDEFRGALDLDLDEARKRPDFHEILGQEINASEAYWRSLLQDNLSYFFGNGVSDSWHEVYMERGSSFAERVLAGLIGSDVGISACARIERLDNLEHFEISNIGELEEDVIQSINSTLQEILRAFSSECYLASIGLCGRVIETILLGLATSRGIEAKGKGTHALRTSLRKEGFIFDEALDRQLDLISSYRNHAVHGSVRIPTRDAAYGVIMHMRDFVRQVEAFSAETSQH